MITTFYASFTPICFTLLGLWLVVVQTRHADWRRSLRLRRRAYAISLSFAFPGLMGLLSLVDPNSKTVWRVAFAVVAGVGLAADVTMRWVSRHDPGGESVIATVAHWLVTAIYALVIVVAIVPDVARDLGVALSGLEVEAFSLSALVFLGVNVACYLVFEESGG